MSSIEQVENPRECSLPKLTNLSLTSMSRRRDGNVEEMDEEMRLAYFNVKDLPENVCLV